MLSITCCYFFFLLVSCSAGFITISNHLISLTKWSYIYFLRSSKNLTQTYGSWALITGSTDGIGKALAFELAITHGLNIILVSRNAAKLNLVRKKIKRLAPNRSVKLVEIDFSSEKDLAAGIERIREVTCGVEVGVLINNVGVTYPTAMYFHETAPAKAPGEEGVWRKVVRVNVEGTTWVTKVVLKGMVERGRGAVVNIGSGAGIVAPSHPLYAMYAATKVYVDQFSRSLHTEYKAKGIDVQCQVPLYVATKMVTNLVAASSSLSGKQDTIQRSTLFTPSPQAYAKAAVRRIGYEPRCTPYWSHSLQWWLASQLPDFLLDEWRLSIGLNRRARANVTKQP